MNRIHYVTDTMDRIFRAVKDPEMPVNQPEPTEAVIERNLRNSIRRDIVDYSGYLLDRLDELDPKGHRNIMRELMELRAYMVREMEDGE